MEKGRSPLVSIPPCGRGFSRHRGLPIRCEFLKSAEPKLPRSVHRLDEPARLTLSMVASPQSPLPFRPASSLYLHHVLRSQRDASSHCNPYADGQLPTKQLQARVGQFPERQVFRPSLTMGLGGTVRIYEDMSAVPRGYEGKILPVKAAIFGLAHTTPFQPPWAARNFGDCR
jgi:hypothetical protein